MKNKKLYRMMLAAAVSACVMSPAIPACAAEQETEAAAEAQDGAQAAQLSENILDFQIQIEGEVYQFPASYEDFMAKGWELADEEDAQEELTPNQYDLVTVVKDGRECRVYVVNLGMNNQTVPECLIGGIEMDTYDWPASEGEVVLAKGITRGKSTLEDIKAAYGEPADVYEGDMYTEYTYEADIYSTVELCVYNESGVLEDIDIENLVVPEGFDAGTVSEEIPEEIAAYTAPETLGEDLSSYTVEFDGALYTLPCPVTELTKNGWEIDTENSAAAVSAHSSDWVYFTKGENEFHILARNNADYAVVPSNCWVEELSAGDYGMEVSLKLPGGLQIGSTREEVEAALNAAGLAYETEEGSSYVIYETGEDSWNCIYFYVCTDEESSIYTPGAVYKIEVSHES